MFALAFLLVELAGAYESTAFWAVRLDEWRLMGLWVPFLRFYFELGVAWTRDETLLVPD